MVATGPTTSPAGRCGPISRGRADSSGTGLRPPRDTTDFPARRSHLRQPAGPLLSPAGTSPSRWPLLLSPHSCPAVPGRRRRQRAARTAQESGGLRQPWALRSRVVTVTRQPTRGPSMRGSVCPALPGCFRQPSAAGAVSSLGSSGVRARSPCCRWLAWVQAALHQNAAGRRVLWARLHPRRERRAHPPRTPGRGPSSAGTRRAGSENIPTGARRGPERATSRSGWAAGTVGQSRVGPLGVEKPGSGSDCSARKSPAFNAGFNTNPRRGHGAVCFSVGE